MSEQTQGLPGPASSLPIGESGELMAHLEERVTRLVERYRQAQTTSEQLKAKLRDRDGELQELRRKLQTLGQSRRVALKRLQGVIARVDRLEKGRDASA
jgi:chromosome segregation ATPase